MRVSLIKLNENGKVPTRGTQFSAGYDIYSAENCVVEAGKWKLVKTGIALYWDDINVYPQISSRSGLAYKKGVSIRAGVIDIDYRQEVGVILMNEGTEDFQVQIGDRIAQFIFQKIESNIEFENVESFPDLETSRTGGFGSTG